MSMFCLQGLLCTNVVWKKTGYCKFGILSARLLCIRNERQNIKMLVFCLQELLQYVSGMTDVVRRQNAKNVSILSLRNATVCVRNVRCLKKTEY